MTLIYNGRKIFNPRYEKAVKPSKINGSECLQVLYFAACICHLNIPLAY